MPGQDKPIRRVSARVSMPGQKLRFNHSMGEKIMKITIMGGILIIVAVFAAVIVLDASVENPSFAPNIRQSIKSKELPSTGPGTPLE
jgi:hypothetical protein